MHQEHPVGHQHGLFLVMGHEQGGQAEGLLNLADLVAQMSTNAGVQRRQRLVHQQYLGFHHQRACQCHPLALPARQLVGKLVRLVLHLYQAQHLVHPARALVTGDLLHAQAEGDVVGDLEVGKQRIVLKHHADSTSLGRQAGDLVTADVDAAGVQRGQPCDGPQQGRLAAAGRPQQGDELAMLDIGVDVGEHRGLAEALGQPPQRDRIAVFLAAWR